MMQMSADAGYAKDQAETGDTFKALVDGKDEEEEGKGREWSR